VRTPSLLAGSLPLANWASGGGGSGGAGSPLPRTQVERALCSRANRFIRLSGALTDSCGLAPAACVPKVINSPLILSLQ